MNEFKQKRLVHGELVVSREPGNSMSPRLKSRQPVLLTPILLEDVRKGNIVFARYGRNYYTHLVHQIGQKGVLLGNLRYPSNGWTRHVYGKVSIIFHKNYRNESYCRKCGLLDLGKDHVDHICRTEIMEYVERLYYLYPHEFPKVVSILLDRNWGIDHDDVSTLWLYAQDQNYRKRSPRDLDRIIGTILSCYFPR